MKDWPFYTKVTVCLPTSQAEGSFWLGYVNSKQKMHYLALRAGIKISHFEKTSKLKEETQGFGNICGFEEQTQLSATKMSFILLFFATHLKIYIYPYPS